MSGPQPFDVAQDEDRHGFAVRRILLSRLDRVGYLILSTPAIATIRRALRLPSDVRYFDPPEAALTRALPSGRTPALVALDKLPADEAHRLLCPLPASCSAPRHEVRAT